MSDLALATAVDHSQTATTLLELHLAGRLVQPVELAGGVGASYELPGQLHVHPVIYSYSDLGHDYVMIEAVLDEDVYEWALKSRCSIGICETPFETIPRLLVSRSGQTDWVR